VASSTIKEPYTTVNGDLVRLSAFNATDPVVQKAVQNLIKPGETTITISHPEKLPFTIGDKRYLSEVSPYQDEYGLDWLIIIVIPESDFMERINANNQITIILILSSIICAIIFCFILARWITVPIISINNAARALARGEWIPVSTLDRNDELAELSHSFKFMASQLRLSFSALQISEEQYLNLFQSSADAILILEGQNIKTLNKAAIELFRITENDARGREIQTLFGHIGPLIADLLQSGQQVTPGPDQDNETVYPSPSGDRILKILITPVQTTSGIISQVQLRDITEQRKACLAYAEREAFRESLMQMEAILNLLPDPTFIIDTQGRIRLWNKAMVTLSGIRSEDMIGKGNYEYSLPFYGKRRLLLIDYALQNDSTVQETYPEIIYYGDHLTAQFWLDSQNGRRFFSATAGPLHDSRGNHIGAIETIRDMTDMKKAHEALELSNKKLNLLSQISRHDILNQITILNGILYLIGLDYDDQPLKRQVDKMVYIVRIIRDQIDFTKIYQKIGATEPVWLNPSVIFKEQAEKFMDTPVHMNQTDSPIEISVDPLFEKVIYNLIDNSIRHGEKITSISLSSRLTGKGAEIIYEDDGAGICQEDKEIIFEPGFGKNSGYGLFLIREILSITEIMIEETGTEGTGARFVMKVPTGRYRVLEDT
jgi:PAS domain S-box-containing protein